MNDLHYNITCYKNMTKKKEKKKKRNKKKKKKKKENEKKINQCLQTQTVFVMK